MESSVDITYHYPPELFNLLVDTIPLLNRSKNDVLTFFRGAGVQANILADLSKRLRSAPKEINKYEIARSVLGRLNDRGEACLRERREVLRRVVEFTNFDSCWPEDQLKVKGLVASVREVVNQKDALTRMNNAREQERQQRLADLEKANREKRDRSARIQASKNELFSLFGSSISAQGRGKRLEAALNNLFRAYGILVREAFHLEGEQGEGIVEQIDAVIEISGNLYFVEMKWYSEAVGRPEISEHLVRLMSRAEARGIFISASGYTGPAVHTAREFLQHKVVVLAELREITVLLEQEGELADFILQKIQAAITHKNPHFNPLE